MVKHAKIDYDQENDSLFVYTEGKVNDSLEIGNYIIDFSQDNGIVNLEISEISEMLKLWKIKKEEMAAVVGASMTTAQARNATYVLINLKIKKAEKVETREICVSVPRAVERAVN